jgi:hypothetical protein
MTSSYVQILFERESDSATIQRFLPDLQEQIQRLLPPVHVRYIPYTDQQYMKLIKRANKRASKSFGLKKDVPPHEIANVVERLKLENPNGFPLFSDSTGKFETNHFESDLFGGDYSLAYLSPRALNMALIEANTLKMTKQNGKFVSRIRVNNQGIHLGQYYHQDAAERVYRLAKSLVLQMIANNYREYLPDRVYQALLNYQV